MRRYLFHFMTIAVLMSVLTTCDSIGINPEGTTDKEAKSSNEAPTWTTNAQTVMACENVSEGTLIATIPEATDKEGNAIRYRLKGGSDYSNLFVINSSNGQISKGSASFNHAIKMTYEVVVFANDGKEDSSKYTLTVHLIPSGPSLWRSKGSNPAFLAPEVTSVCIGEQAFTFQADKTISFYDTGNVKTGFLNTDVVWTNHGHGLFTLSDVITHFYENGIVNIGRLTSPSTWTNGTQGEFTFKTTFIELGITVGRRIVFYDNGVVMEGALASNATWTNGRHGKFTFSRVNPTNSKTISILHFYDNGGVMQGVLASNATWTNGTTSDTRHGEFTFTNLFIAANAVSTLHFYDNGGVSNGILGSPATWKNGSYGDFVFRAANITFHSNGVVQQGILNEEKTLSIGSTATNYTFPERANIGFDSDGNLTQAFGKGGSITSNTYIQFNVDGSTNGTSELWDSNWPP